MFGEKAGADTKTIGPQREVRLAGWFASKPVLHATAAAAWIQQSSPEAVHLLWCGQC